MIQSIVVAGAGTMGSGIALSAASGGYPVTLFDTQPAALERASRSIQQILDGLLQKQKLSEADRQLTWERISFASDVTACRADLVIEAIVEIIEAKAALFETLAAVNGPDTIYASNTSSLSIDRLQELFVYPAQLAGLHFFNPAHLMKLVEVVKGAQTNDGIVAALTTFCVSLQKVPVVCNDSPGFIVNRVARHFYLESLHLAEQGYASFQDIDALVEASGFKMGPFKLMDLIGMDINLAVSTSLYEAFHQAPRFKPSALQQQKVAEGNLGRKTGKGFYDYGNA